MKKYLLGITLLLSSFYVTAEIKINYETRSINNDGLTYKTAIISKSLLTSYEQTDRAIRTPNI